MLNWKFSDISQLGIDVGALLGVVVEQLLGLQGLGQRTFIAIAGRRRLVIGFVIPVALYVVVANLIDDIAYAQLDPRVRN